MKFIAGDQQVEAELSYGKLIVSGDDTKGYRPYQLLVSAVASCSLSVFKRVLEKKRINFDHIEVEAEVGRKESEANRIESIELNFKISGEGLKQEALEKSLAVSSRNCAMVRSVESSIKITEKIEII